MAEPSGEIRLRQSATAIGLSTSCIFGDPHVQDARIREETGTDLLIDVTPIFAGSCGHVLPSFVGPVLQLAFGYMQRDRLV